jgi:putative membrane protein
VHCFIFYLESIAWTSPRSRATFATTEETAEITRPLAFNQGFYNLFLAIAVFLGIALFSSQRAVGATLVLVGVASMLAAALVLALSDRTKLRAATIQGTAPLLAVIALVIGLLAA